MGLSSALPNPFHFAPIAAGRHDAEPPSPVSHGDRFAENLALIDRMEGEQPLTQRERFARDMARLTPLETLSPSRQEEWNAIIGSREEPDQANAFEAVCFLMMKDLADIVAGIDARRAVEILQRIAS